jgi:hypothetical protein
MIQAQTNHGLSHTLNTFKTLRILVVTQILPCDLVNPRVTRSTKIAWSTPTPHTNIP